jgi:asparagine synthase (glutamine-hydrolysing)
MCGIAGYLGVPLSANEAAAKLRTMGQALRLRGPDDEGTFVDAAAELGLVHRRLSIIDLSPTGHQPMFSADGRYTIVFNGEIYNFASLRATLATAGSRFVGTSDTEVLLHSIGRWGLRGALTRAIGMFALALWDREERVLYLARDRLGEKPLCIARLPRGLAFASDFATLRKASFVSPTVDPRSLALFLKYGYVPAPHAIHEHSSKVVPGTIVAITRSRTPPSSADPWTAGGVHGDLFFFHSVYWDPSEVARSAENSPRAASAQETQARFDDLLQDAVGLQLHADVPVGAFLSGGIDSSLVCSVAQSLAGKPVKTFTMGFDDPLFDESVHAAAVARHLGTEHTCVIVSAADVLRQVPRIAEIYDEPFADPSQLPTLMVAEIARREVTVSLTGDGGDELFGGYRRYFDSLRVRREAERLSQPAAKLLAAALRIVPARAVDAAAGVLSRLSRSSGLGLQSPGEKLHKIADTLTATHPRALYEALITLWPEPGLVQPDAPDPRSLTLGAEARRWTWESFAEEAMLWDLEHYLPDNNLAKVDRASMGVSLETRLPLLDHRIVEFAIQTPVALKIADGSGKRVLRRSLAGYLPRNLIDRPKMGFSVPVAAWLRGPLRDWAGDLLSPATTSRIGFFDPVVLGRVWHEHLTGRRDHYQKLWAVIQAHCWSLAARGVS